MDSLFYKVRNFCKFIIFGLIYILFWKVVFLLILYVNLKCDIEYFFFILIRGRFFLELLFFYIVINVFVIFVCVRNIDIKKNRSFWSEGMGEKIDKRIICML